MEWFNCWKSIEASSATFLFLNGGRGIGKTYSMLKGHYERYKRGEIGKMLYVRMTTAELVVATGAETSQYNAINHDTTWDLRFIKVDGSKQDIFYITDFTEDPENPEIIGFAAALSNFGNLRGMDFSDYDIIYFDEYIPSDRAVKTAVVKKAGWLVYNMYETVNRNRELKGMEPVRMIFNANSFSLESSILEYFDVVKTFQSMQQTGQLKASLPDRGIYCERCSAPTITEMKKTTAIYKALGHKKEVAEIALGNNFIDRAMYLTQKVNVIEYNPIVQIGDITLYKHKSNRTYYAAKKKAVGVPHLSEDEVSLFKIRYGYIVKAGIATLCLFFDGADTMIKILEYVQ